MTAQQEKAQVLYAYEIYSQKDMPIETAPVERSWMEARDRFAYRCLPLAIANQAGWFINNPTGFSATWNGGLKKQDTIIEFDDSRKSIDPSEQIIFAGAGGVIDLSSSDQENSQPAEKRIVSHFGSGIVTFSLPYLFRTPAGVNLWVKGPSNFIKGGAQALEGIVESDWVVATFTMNWKLTVVGQPVRFEQGEPCCMVVPVPRGFAEDLEPRIAPLSSNDSLQKEYLAWQNSRSDFLQGLQSRREDVVKRKWEKHYFKGQTRSGEAFTDHQTKLELKPFSRQ